MIPPSTYNCRPLPLPDWTPRQVDLVEIDASFGKWKPQAISTLARKAASCAELPRHTQYHAFCKHDRRWIESIPSQSGGSDESDAHHEIYSRSDESDESDESGSEESKESGSEESEESFHL